MCRCIQNCEFCRRTFCRVFFLWMKFRLSNRTRRLFIADMQLCFFKESRLSGYDRFHKIDSDTSIVLECFRFLTGLAKFNGMLLSVFHRPASFAGVEKNSIRIKDAAIYLRCLSVWTVKVVIFVFRSIIRIWSSFRVSSFENYNWICNWKLNIDCVIHMCITLEHNMTHWKSKKTLCKVRIFTYSEWIITLG